MDNADSSPPASTLLSTGAVALPGRLGEALPPAHATGMFVAAIRETFEEAGLRFAYSVYRVR